MVDYETAFKKPFSDLKKLLVAFLLNIVPIVNLLVYGYFLEVAKTSGGKKPSTSLPDWKNWGNLFVNGLKALVVSLVYALPLIAVAVVLSLALGISFRTSSWSEFAGFGSWLGLLLIFALAFAYFVPSAIVSFALSGKFSKSFEFKEVLRKALTREYFVVWLVSIVYSAVLGALLGLIPFVGKALAGAVSGITMFSLFGEVYPTLGMPEKMKLAEEKAKKKK